MQGKPRWIRWFEGFKDDRPLWLSGGARERIRPAKGLSHDSVTDLTQAAGTEKKKMMGSEQSVTGFVQILSGDSELHLLAT